MWAGKSEDPPCITIFSAANYCGHENPGSILITGNAKAKAQILVYDECQYTNYFLPNAETGRYPEEPYDCINWFMPAMGEWFTEIFQTVIDKMREAEESGESEGEGEGEGDGLGTKIEVNNMDVTMVKKDEGPPTTDGLLSPQGAATFNDLVAKYAEQYERDDLSSESGAS